MAAEWNEQKHPRKADGTFDVVVPAGITGGGPGEQDGFTSVLLLGKDVDEAPDPDALVNALRREIAGTTGPQRLDLAAPEWEEAFAAAPTFEKFATVVARPATKGQRVDTILASGTVETTNVAEDGDYVVTNPSGEQYLVSGEKFRSRYRATDEPGKYQANGMVRAVQNTSGPVAITAPWGEDMTGESGCWLVEAVDPANPDARSADRYLIGEKEFAETYRPRIAKAPRVRALSATTPEDYEARMADVHRQGRFSDDQADYPDAVIEYEQSMGSDERPHVFRVFRYADPVSPTGETWHVEFEYPDQFASRYVDAGRLLEGLDAPPTAEGLRDAWEDWIDSD